MGTSNFEQAMIESAREQRARVEKNEAMAAMMVDLRYVETRSGDLIDLMGLQAAIAWHLTRCGWRPDPDKRMIKARRVIAQGVGEGAIEWVDVDEPDDPLANLANMTMAQINALPSHLKAQAMRRMGGPETEALPTNPGWKVETSIQIEEAPDPNDTEAWIKGVPE